MDRYWHGPLPAGLLSVGEEVVQQGHLGQVMDHLAVDMQHQSRHRALGVPAFGWPAGPVQPCGSKRADTTDPAAVVLVQQGQCATGSAWIVEILVADRRAAEV